MSSIWKENFQFGINWFPCSGRLCQLCISGSGIMLCSALDCTYVRIHIDRTIRHTPPHIVCQKGKFAYIYFSAYIPTYINKTAATLITQFTQNGMPLHNMLKESKWETFVEQRSIMRWEKFFGVQHSVFLLIHTYSPAYFRINLLSATCSISIRTLLVRILSFDFFHISFSWDWSDSATVGFLVSTLFVFLVMVMNSVLCWFFCFFFFLI